MEHLLLTRFDPSRSNSGEMLSIEVCLNPVDPLLGVIRKAGNPSGLEHRGS